MGLQVINIEIPTVDPARMGRAIDIIQRNHVNWELAGAVPTLPPDRVFLAPFRNEYGEGSPEAELACEVVARLARLRIGGECKNRLTFLLDGVPPAEVSERAGPDRPAALRLSLDANHMECVVMAGELSRALLIEGNPDGALGDDARVTFNYGVDGREGRCEVTPMGMNLSDPRHWPAGTITLWQGAEEEGADGPPSGATLDEAVGKALAPHRGRLNGRPPVPLVGCRPAPVVHRSDGELAMAIFETLEGDFGTLQDDGELEARADLLRDAEAAFVQRVAAEFEPAQTEIVTVTAVDPVAWAKANDPSLLDSPAASKRTQRDRQP